MTSKAETKVMRQMPVREITMTLFAWCCPLTSTVHLCLFRESKATEVLLVFQGRRARREKQETWAHLVNLGAQSIRRTPKAKKESEDKPDFRYEQSCQQIDVLLKQFLYKRPCLHYRAAKQLVLTR